MTMMNQATSPAEARMGGQDGGEEQQSQQQNVGQAERVTSIAAGSILTILGLSRGSLPGLLIAGVGGAMAYRGITGHCPMYESMGVNTAESDEESLSRNE